MTGDIINLRKARKARKQRDKDTRAAENRVVFGRTKSERDRSKAESTHAERRIDAHLRAPEKVGENTADPRPKPETDPDA
ncbi:DUF4169 family protein [Stappia sp. ES.058]|uniref:DUF4169 family protein n=1 Tax=Stappia sp. ES.058 TaxID=1881061 RepID=UPI000879E5C7|nr:DUF4169 family protein [Stappia sp. ES.058]SDU26539.1 protein of unknown function [Stappia sp. ES.058]